MTNNLWWLNPSIEWNKIGQDNILRPTETKAFQNIAYEAKTINMFGLSKSDLLLTKTEWWIYKLDLEVSKEDFDYKRYDVFKKDSNIRKISKITGYSETFILKKLNDISNKIRLADKLGYDNLSIKYYNNTYKRTKRNKLSNKQIINIE